MKKLLLATISVMACCAVQAQEVSQADVEKYLQAHPEAVQNYVDNQQKPASQSPQIAQMVLSTIQSARQKGIIQPDGHFVVNEKGSEVAGQLFCADSVLEQNLKQFETEVALTSPDGEKLRRNLDTLLRCASISKLDYQGPDSSVKFTGEFKFPFFADKSTLFVKANNKVNNISFGLNGNEQTVTIEVLSDKGEKLSFGSFQYDAERLSFPFEAGMVTGFVERMNASANIREQFVNQLQAWSQKNNPLTEKVFRINKAEIYQPDGKKVLIMNGENENRFILRIFNSVEREFINALWADNTLKIKLSFPQSDKRLLESETRLSPMFQENYKKFMQMLSQNPNYRPEKEVAQMLSGLKQDITLYGTDGQPLARLKAKLNDNIETTERPENVIDFATLTMLKPSANCSVRSVSFIKSNPNVFTVCGSNGCAEQPVFSAFSQLSACLEKETTEVFTQFGEEIKSEVDKLNQVYIPGVSDGYNLAMDRYRANEILNAAAIVAVAATSAKGGMGADADLSDLGGAKAMKLDEFVSSDQGIRSDKNGLVTIELKPELAPNVMPIIKEGSGRRVVSGCTADTNLCVIDMARSVK